MENQGKKLAVLVGCNYTGTTHELEGCINDAKVMGKLLVSRFGFNEENLETLIDEPGSVVQPTGDNIMNSLNRMVEKAQNGDILFFLFSGHGTLIRSTGTEAIVPCDRNIITDVDFRDLVNRMPMGVTLTIFSDSCHSGGLIAQEKEQIGPSTDTKNETNIQSLKSKFIPIESILQYLSSKTGINSSDVGTHLLELFGSKASLMFHLPQYQDAGMDKQYRPDNGILLSACQNNENASDIPMGRGIPVKEPSGAFSFAVQSVLGEIEGPINNKELVMLARNVLNEYRFYDQHPCLYCSDANATATFLM